jgi:hypothetical protein
MTANEKYNQFVKLTTAQKIAYIVTDFEAGLKQNADLETHQAELESQAIIDQAVKKDKLITFLKSKGFKCDNSEFDWIKLYNRPEIFGKGWRLQAENEFISSNGIDYFLEKVLQIINQL